MVAEFNPSSKMLSLAWRLVAAWLWLRTRFSNWVQLMLVYLLLALSLMIIAAPALWDLVVQPVCSGVGLCVATFALLWKLVLADAMVHSSVAGPIGIRAIVGFLGREATNTPLAITARTNAQAAGWSFPSSPAYLECALVNWLASPQALARWQAIWLEGSTPRSSGRPRSANRL